MNFFSFAQSPTCYRIHALKPTTSIESKGYGLGYWRPPSDTNMTHLPNIKPRSWDYNPINYNVVAGFAKLMPWDSVRHNVEEDCVRQEARI